MSRIKPLSNSLIAIAACAAMLTLLGTANEAQAIPVGAGTGITLETVDTPGNQPRLNVDESFTISLNIGTYAVSDFSFAAGQTGSVTPFVAVGNGADNYRALASGDQVDIAAVGTQTVAFGGTQFFSITSNNTTVHAGISNPPGSQNPIFLDNNTGTTTDHDSSFTHVSAATIGDSFGGFSNANLPRTYAFSLEVQDANLSRAGAGIGIAHDVLDNAGSTGGARTNIDKSFSLTLGPGKYNVTDFEFAAGRAGSVTPFLAVLDGNGNYEIIALGDTATANGNEDVTVGFGGDNMFTLDAITEVFAGITNEGLNPVFLDNNTGAITDHDGTPTLITNTGQLLALSDISNQNLGRTYAFAIGVEQVTVPEPATAILSLFGIAGLVARRRRHAA